MTEALVKVEGLSKKFCRSLRRSLWYGLQDLGNEMIGRRHFAQDGLRADEFWAVRDVSFALSRGECLGLIGHNGAGKTTLLRTLSGLIRPDVGRIEIRGRVGALIALGAGFHPLLSGRENIHINAAILGYSARETRGMMDEIVAFAEIDEFIDAPVQSYSSGMYMRLGFAVAAHLTPDVMFVDEVLAVGDTQFQRKCFDRILRLRNAGTCFVIVSHSPWQIETLCDRAAVLDRGRMSAIGPAKDAQALYHDLRQRELRAGAAAAHEAREGTHSVYFESVRVGQEGRPVDAPFESGQPLRIVARLQAPRPTRNVRFRFEVCSQDNAIVTMLTTIGLTEGRTFEGGHEIAFHLRPCQLTSGWYYVNAIATDTQVRLDTWRRAVEFKVVLKDLPGRNLTSDVGAFVSQGHWEISG